MYSPTAGLPFDDEELESRLVWIWGSPRSGSTWLLRLLAHPSTLGDYAPLGFNPPARQDRPIDVLPVNESFLANHLAPLVRGALYDDAGNAVTLSSFFDLHTRPNYFFSPQYEDVWRPEVRRLALVRFHALIERAGRSCEVASPLVVIKEVNGPHAAELIMSVLPRSRLIFLVRDGRGVLDSQLSASKPEGFLFKGETGAFRTTEERERWVREQCRVWVGDMDTIQRAYARHPEALRRTIGYERLRQNPSGELGALAEWLGLARDSEWVEGAVEASSFDRVPEREKGPLRFFRSARPGTWRTNLTKEEQRVALEVMGEKLEELGYSA